MIEEPKLTDQELNQEPEAQKLKPKKDRNQQLVIIREPMINYHKNTEVNLYKNE